MCELNKKASFIFIIFALNLIIFTIIIRIDIKIIMINAVTSINIRCRGHLSGTQRLGRSMIGCNLFGLSKMCLRKGVLLCVLSRTSLFVFQCVKEIKKKTLTSK